MTTNELVRTAWDENVFDNINAGQNSYSRIVDPKSQSDIALCYHADTKRIYAWFYVVTSHDEQNDIGGGVNVRDKFFKVEITHIREKGEGGQDADHNAVIDGFETVATYMRSNLGTTWDSTVDYYLKPSEVTIDSAEFDGKPVWRGKQVYTARKKLAS